VSNSHLLNACTDKTLGDDLVRAPRAAPMQGHRHGYAAVIGGRG
jgi:hypothetical protein